MKRALRHPIEAFRTAPFQIPFIGLCPSAAVFLAYEAVEYNGTALTGPAWAAAALNLGYTAIAVATTKNKIDLRDSVEDQLSRNGFNERVMGLTTRAYCTRQAARVACENFGFEEEYQKLCDEKSDGAVLTWLPHI